jgi:hypothetical protein
MRRTVMVYALLFSFFSLAHAQRITWRAASPSELQSLLPARAPVVQERIETEMRTASGIISSQGQFVGGVVLITAGYSADGKYSHFFVTQAPIRMGNLQLSPGQYVFGYDRQENALQVKFYDASTGRLLGEVDATLNPAITRVESFRIWPPGDRALIQIGRFTFPYQL